MSVVETAVLRPSSSNHKTSSRKILVAQIGARRHYAVPRALEHMDMLEMLVTDACSQVFPWAQVHSALPNLLCGGSLSRLLERRVHGVPTERIVGMLGYVISEAFVGRRGRRKTDLWATSNRNFCRRVVRNGFGEAAGVYAFNGAALEIFQAAKKKGLRTILDQTAAPWSWNSRMLIEESKRWPGWEDIPSEVDTCRMLAAREEAEWELADAIVCGSGFCREALVEAGAPAERCKVLRYPVPPVSGPPERDYGSRPEIRPIRVLFVGTFQLRKGIQYLVEAIRALSGEPIEVRLVGPSSLSAAKHSQVASYCHVTGPVARSELEKHYRWADMFVFPTLSEGSANVCAEAMISGLPVITTRASGSAVRHGIDGVIVPERDAKALASEIVRLAYNPGLRQRWGKAARQQMKTACSFDAYAKALQDLMKSVLAL